MLIFELSESGRRNASQAPRERDDVSDIPSQFRRQRAPLLPQVSELQAVRHYTGLSQRNFAIDTQFYPLGSCTMKYNPRACNRLAMLPSFLGRHPYASETTGQGFLACLYELQEILKEVTGMAAVSLTPLAGAQGEFTGVAMIRAYHDAHNDSERSEILVPDAAHGTNPATATMCGYAVREVPTAADGDVDITALKHTEEALRLSEERYALAFSDLGALRVALDQDLSDFDAPLNGVREVAFFPPMTGG